MARFKKAYENVVEEHHLEKILGIAQWDGEEKEREERGRLWPCGYGTG